MLLLYFLSCTGKHWGCDICNCLIYSLYQLLHVIYLHTIHTVLYLTSHEKIQWGKNQRLWLPCSSSFSSSTDPTHWEFLIQELPYNVYIVNRCSIILINNRVKMWIEWGCCICHICNVFLFMSRNRVLNLCMLGHKWNL